MSESAVLITGGTGGLGRAVVAAALARGEAVVVPWIVEDEVPRLKSFLEVAGADPSGLHLVRADVTTDDGMRAALDAVPSGVSLRSAALLVGGFAMGGIAETDRATWDRLTALNATSVFTAARALFPILKANGGGSIVAVAAPAALDRGSEGMSAYAATKAAVVSLVRTLAKEGAPHRIRVNAVAPDIIDTPANRAAMPDADASTWLTPGEIAGVIGFLSSAPGAVVNGAVLTLTRGG